MIFEITDNGIGMSKEESDKIFELFYKKQNSSGTGLGLFIVKLCVDKLKGKITVNSKPDEGSKFTVTIPNQIFKVK
jgi:signal transduction histidine kinase